MWSNLGPFQDRQRLEPSRVGKVGLAPDYSLQRHTYHPDITLALCSMLNKFAERILKESIIAWNEGELKHPVGLADDPLPYHSSTAVHRYRYASTRPRNYRSARVLCPRLEFAFPRFLQRRQSARCAKYARGESGLYLKEREISEA